MYKSGGVFVLFACACVINDVPIMMLHCLKPDLEHYLCVNGGIYHVQSDPLSLKLRMVRELFASASKGLIGAAYCNMCTLLCVLNNCHTLNTS